MRSRRPRGGLLLWMVLAAACSRGPAPPSRPPVAEFLLAAGDSTFWVRADPDGLRIRRSPMLLGHFGGRFYELYVADDDRSFFDAVMVGVRVYRRDLIANDSLLVFADSRIPQIASAYAATHPDESPVGPDDDTSDDPHTSATADADLLDVHGPYLSLEHHRDIEIVSGEDSHAVRRLVVDLRTGQRVGVRALSGDSAVSDVVAAGRAAFAAARDSVRSARDPRARRAAQAIGAFRFDSASFSITDLDDEPAIGFFVPGRGDAAGGLGLALPPIPLPEASWWRDDVRPALPHPSMDSTEDTWPGDGYDVVARYDTSGEWATLVVRDRASHEWVAGRIPAPARQVYRLDAPPVDSAARAALSHAFDQSGLYSGDARTASWSPPRTPRRAHPRASGSASPVATTAHGS